MTVLLWFAAIGSGLVAGLFFAFSVFIMTALARVPAATGMLVMQSINSTILESLFIPLFFGTTLAALVLCVAAPFVWGSPAATAMLGGGALYVVGMFLCTVLFNVPLNNELARAGIDSAAGAAVWSRYLKDWTFWNHVRTIASTVACGCFLAALVTRGGG